MYQFILYNRLQIQIYDRNYIFFNCIKYKNETQEHGANRSNMQMYLTSHKPEKYNSTFLKNKLLPVLVSQTQESMIIQVFTKIKHPTMILHI